MDRLDDLRGRDDMCRLAHHHPDLKEGAYSVNQASSQRQEMTLTRSLQ